MRIPALFVASLVFGAAAAAVPEPAGLTPLAPAATTAKTGTPGTAADAPTEGDNHHGPPRVPSLPRRTVDHEGVTFELANSTATATVETDEYVAAGEKLVEWTQLVTVQRLRLAKPQSAEEFVAFFRRKIEAEDGATLETLNQGKPASVFVVRFPKSDRNDEQLIICLAFVDALDPARLNVVQYAVKPARVAPPLVESRLKSWRDKFLRQAESLASAAKS